MDVITSYSIHYTKLYETPEAGGDQLAHMEELLGETVVELDEELLVGDLV